MSVPTPGSLEYLQEALDYIDAHAPEGDEASLIAQEALAGTWSSPECCNGHGLERREEEA